MNGHNSPQQPSASVRPLSPEASSLEPRADVRSLVFALAGTFVLRCASYGAGIIIPTFLGLKSHTQTEYTANLVALISVSFYAAELLGAPVFGALSDRHGRRLFMLLGPIFGGVAIQMLGLTAIIPVLILVRVLEGLSTASSSPATLGFLSAETAGSEQSRGRVMGFYEAATVVGLASGAAVGGRLYDAFHGWAFTLVALIYLLALFLFWFVRDTGKVSVRRRGPGELLARLLNPRIMRFAPAWLAANAVLGAWFSVGPFLAAGVPNPSQFLMGAFRAGEIGTAFLLFGVLFTAGAIAWGFVMPLIGRQATLLAGVAGLAFMTVTLRLLNSLGADGPAELVVPLVLLVALGVLFESGFTPAALAYLAEIAEEQAEDRGSVMGLYSVLLSIGQLVGGALAGPFAMRWGANGLIGLTGVLCVVAAATVLMLGHVERLHARQRRAEATTAASAVAAE